ncbi:MAG TPA: ROK family protein [Gaiellaceae bacterium]|nr:ROK family protein [Gaiellaceae bacterium]
MGKTRGHAIGIDLGGTKILAGVVTREGEILRRHERPTPTDSQAELLDEVEVAVSELLDGGVAAIGFGIPAPIDQRRGRVFVATNIPLADVDFRDRMRERFGVPVGLDNDANAAAIAEWRTGAARGANDVVMITLGTGVGGGVIANGAPFRGGGGAGMELGHTVVIAHGPPCQGTCTGRGHLEAVASGRAADEAAKEAFGPAADAHLLVRLANEGDAQARAILERIGGLLGCGLESFANIFSPELIVIGGGFGLAAWDHLIPPAERVLRREALLPARDDVRIVPAELGTAAGLIGAAFVAYEALDAG